MLNLKQIALGTLGVALVWGANASTVNAQYYSQGEVSDSILIDKKIRFIKEKTFFDNIDKNYRVFLNGDILEFSVKVENNSDHDMENISVKDSLPDNLELIFYPGTYKSSNNSIEWKIDKLLKGESKTYQIRAKVAGVLTSGKRSNLADATKDGAYDKDQAVYYVGVQTVPVTGSETLIVNSALGFLGIISAFGLRKFARGY